MTSSATTPWPRDLPSVLLVVLALTAGAVATVMVWAGGGGAAGASDTLIGILFLLWNLTPIAGMAGVVLFARRRRPTAAAVTLGVLGLAGLVTTLLVDFVRSDSSTAALLFIFQPLYLWLVAGLTAGLAAASLWLVDRRRARSQASRRETVVRTGDG
ncbi:hypothetical protein [Pseudokineococcus lusitanus]|uniref:Uncharacterized protein n=1 Tax=Pseudokineococcus lusitanus TaxID=763993 RepID=A0A3N1G9V5_9ACTN|nr:hypothetical protein [Pseudokineococcus lusitanus]ROP26958.1 hypothetical protein EDC03_2886 [Pseudokineococcus lusitanus]